MLKWGAGLDQQICGCLRNVRAVTGRGGAGGGESSQCHLLSILLHVLLSIPILVTSSQEDSSGPPGLHFSAPVHFSRAARASRLHPGSHHSPPHPRLASLPAPPQAPASDGQSPFSFWAVVPTPSHHPHHPAPSSLLSLHPLILLILQASEQMPLLQRSFSLTS